MSLILIIVFILNDMSLAQELHISPDRICRQNKDYVDASVMFRDSFWVIVDRMYYEYSWYTAPFTYKAEGVQEIFLREYDQTWPISKDEKVNRGRFLGGFYHNPLDKIIGYYRSTDNQVVDVDLSPYDINKHPYWLNGIVFTNEDITKATEQLVAENPPHNHSFNSIDEYIDLTEYRQIVVFKDEYNNHNKYHIKLQTKDGLKEYHDHLSFHNVTARGSLESFLTPTLPLPPRLQSLPMVYDFGNLMLYVIINQRDQDDTPRLYYNSFKYSDFANNWKYVNITKGFRYNAIIPQKVDNGLGLGREMFLIFDFKVIAEPFRDTKSDKERGPSFLFELGWNEEANKPYMTKLKGSGLSLFTCKFEPLSSRILYIVFGAIISILIAILVIMLCFVSVNYFLHKERIVIVRNNNKHKTSSSNQGSNGPGALDGGSVRQRANSNAESLDDTKRSATITSLKSETPIET